MNCALRVYYVLALPLFFYSLRPMETNTDKLNKVLAFVRSHGITAWIDSGLVLAISVYTDANRQVHEETVIVGSSFIAARNWLGY